MDSRSALTSRRILRALALAGVVSVTAAACGGSAEGGQDGGGGAPVADAEFRATTTQDPGCLDPQQTQLRNVLQWGRQLVDSLVYEGSDGQVTPWLATAWTVNENATEFTFDLRDDVVFADGSSFDAETVKANLDALKALGSTASVAAAYLRTYLGTEVVSPTQVRITFEQPNAQFLYGLSTPNLGMYSTQTAGISAEARCAGDFSASGPFSVQEYTQNERLVMTRNDDYAWGPDALANTGAAHVKTVTFNVISDSSTIAGVALSGDSELAFGVGDQDVEALRAEGWTNADAPEPALSVSWIIRLGNGLAGTDESVRQALMTGVDREGLAGAMGATMSPATGLLNSSHPFHVDQPEALAYDPEAAKAGLEAAGWEMGSDGFYAKDGQRLSVNTIFYTEGAQEVMELAKQQLAEIGVELTLSPVTANDEAERRASGDFEMRLSWFTGPEPTVLGNVFAETNPPAEITGFIGEQAAVTDFDARSAVVEQFQEAVLDQALLVPLWEQNSTPFWGPQVQDMTRDVAGLAMLTQVQVTEG